MNARRSTPAREWVAYARVSKVGGREGDSFVSPDQQTQRIKAAVEADGGTVAMTLIELDESGRSMSRKKLNEALQWVYQDPSRRGFAVMDISRLARNLKGALGVIDTLKKVGAGFLSVHERMDTSTSSGRLAIQNMAAIHEFQSNTIADRWKMVQEDRVAEGLPSGGAARFGYEAVETTDENGRVRRARVHTPHPTNGPVLAEMYRDFIAGKGAKAVAKALNERGVKTERGNLWNIQGVLRTLDCGFGAGLVLVNHYKEEVQYDADGSQQHDADGLPVVKRLRGKPELVEGKHDGVITLEEWERYLAVREARKTKGPRHKHPKWHLAGLAKCGLCGASLTVNSYREARTLVICTAYKTASAQNRVCSGVWMTKSKLDRAVFWWLGSRIEELAQNTGSKRQRERGYAKAVNARDKARARLEKLGTEFVGMARLYAAGDLTDDQYRLAKRENKAELEATRQAIAEAEADVERLAPNEDVYESLIEMGKRFGAAPAPTVAGAPGQMVPHLLQEGHEDEHADALTKEALRVLASDDYAAKEREALGGDSAAIYNSLLSKVIDRIEVTKEQVLIRPVVGKPHDIPRL